MANSTKTGGEDQSALDPSSSLLRDRRPIVTTSWDDGNRLDLRIAQLLDEYSLKGTFYIPKEYRDRSLSDYEVRAINGRHEIGAHGLSHLDLTAVPLRVARNEILGSKTYLEELLGHEIKMFCYPFGRYNPRITAIVREANFKGAKTKKKFELSYPRHPFEIGTTINVFPHHPLYFVKRFFKLRRLHSLSASLSGWDAVARKTFDHVLRYGGVWHLWGHSSEIEEHSLWSRLRRVLQHVSNREGVIYCSNGELVSLYPSTT